MGLPVTNYPKLDSHMSGNTGEYLVCGELGRRNILGLLAPKNNPLYDIVATNEEGTHTVHIQVKTSQQHVHSWTLSKKMLQKKNNNNLYVVLVKLMDNAVGYYVLKYDELADKLTRKYATSSNENITITAKDFESLELLDTLSRWDRLGF